MIKNVNLPSKKFIYREIHLHTLFMTHITINWGTLVVSFDFDRTVVEFLTYTLLIRHSTLLRRYLIYMEDERSLG